MTIHHILKDGTEVPDISGYVVPVEGHEALYQMIRQLERKEEQNEESNQTDL